MTDPDRVTGEELHEARRNPDRPTGQPATSLADLLAELPPRGPIRPDDEPPLFEGDAGRRST